MDLKNKSLLRLIMNELAKCGITSAEPSEGEFHTGWKIIRGPMMLEWGTSRSVDNSPGDTIYIRIANKCEDTEDIFDHMAAIMRTNDVDPTWMALVDNDAGEQIAPLKVIVKRYPTGTEDNEQAMGWVRQLIECFKALPT